MKSEIYLLDKKIGKITKKRKKKEKERNKNFGILTILSLKWHHCDIKQ